MSNDPDSISASVIDYCASIGKDPLLVQGAGGNVSWKDNNTLWIKASGTWLSDAAIKDIFVPVDLLHLLEAVQLNNFSVIPRLAVDATLRPSIETLLHALMPQRIVAHLHAIEILAHLVRENCASEVSALVGDKFRYATIKYHKPGSRLAEAVKNALAKTPDAQIIFLENHGVIIGGDSVLEVKKIMGDLVDVFYTQPIAFAALLPCVSSLTTNAGVCYTPVPDEKLQQLAVNTALFSRVQNDWAICPDHVVFLGEKAFVYPSAQDFLTESFSETEAPPIVFIQNTGVFVAQHLSPAKHAQLQCFYEVLSRQVPDQKLLSLSKLQAAELLDWEAEKHRQEIAKYRAAGNVI